jgi:4a-hydroxytetrahydrobiopterin dehydratase
MQINLESLAEIVAAGKFSPPAPPVAAGKERSEEMTNENSDTGDLKARHCRPCEGGTPPLPEAVITEMLGRLEGWEYAGGKIVRLFHFKNWCQTMAFVNAVAWIAHRENHHPDLEVGYGSCRVSYTTHAIGGLSENDFICAAKVEALFEM